MIDSAIWLFVIMLIVGCVWACWRIIRPTPPQPRPIQRIVAPAADPPLPTYLRKWTPARRVDARRVAEQWQEEFELAAPRVIKPRRAGGLQRK